MTNSLSTWYLTTSFPFGSDWLSLRKLGIDVALKRVRRRSRDARQESSRSIKYKSMHLNFLHALSDGDILDCRMIFRSTTLPRVMYWVVYTSID